MKKLIPIKIDKTKLYIKMHVISLISKKVLRTYTCIFNLNNFNFNMSIHFFFWIQKGMYYYYTKCLFFINVLRLSTKVEQITVTVLLKIL